MTVIEKMHKHHPQMTETDKKIYMYILNNRTLFSLQPIADVAKKLSISTTSLMRFAKFIGFSGYAAFKKQLQLEEILHSSAGDRLQSLRDSQYSHSSQSMYRLERESLKGVLSQMNLREFELAVEAICTATDIFCVGLRENALSAQTIAYRLQSIGLPVGFSPSSFKDVDDCFLSHAEGKVLILFDQYPYSRRMRDLCQDCQEKKGKIILVTDYPTCPHVAFSDFSFFAPSKTDYLLNSLLSTMFFINLLFSEVIDKTKDEVIPLLTERDERRKNSGEYLL